MNISNFPCVWISLSKIFYYLPSLGVKDELREVHPGDGAAVLDAPPVAGVEHEDGELEVGRQTPLALLAAPGAKVPVAVPVPVPAVDGSHVEAGVVLEGEGHVVQHFPEVAMHV